MSEIIYLDWFMNFNRRISKKKITLLKHWTEVKTWIYISLKLGICFCSVFLALFNVALDYIFKYMKIMFMKMFKTYYFLCVFRILIKETRKKK